MWPNHFTPRHVLEVNENMCPDVQNNVDTKLTERSQPGGRKGYITYDSSHVKL